MLQNKNEDNTAVLLEHLKLLKALIDEFRLNVNFKALKTLILKAQKQ